MILRLMTASAVALLLATPAFADCEAEIASLDEAVIAAETGAATGEIGVPMTEHQEDVLAEAHGEMEADTAGTADPVTEHQQEVTRELTEADRAGISALLAEAREMAAAGDEDACMAKVQEARAMLGAGD